MQLETCSPDKNSLVASQHSEETAHYSQGSSGLPASRGPCCHHLSHESLSTPTCLTWTALSLPVSHGLDRPHLSHVDQAILSVLYGSHHPHLSHMDWTVPTCLMWTRPSCLSCMDHTIPTCLTWAGPSPPVSRGPGHPVCLIWITPSPPASRGLDRPHLSHVDQAILSVLCGQCRPTCLTWTMLSLLFISSVATGQLLQHPQLGRSSLDLMQLPPSLPSSLHPFVSRRTKAA